MREIDDRQKQLDLEVKKVFLKNGYTQNHLRKNPPKSNKYTVRKRKEG